MIRRASSDDADAVTRVFRDSRAYAMPWLPVVRTEEDVRAHFAGGVLDAESAWVYENDGCVLGFVVLDDAGLHHLYVAPDALRCGVGSALFAQAQAARPEGFRFWAFRDNERARRFYDRRGCTVVDATDGDNEEGMPDVLYEWRPTREAAEA